MERVEIERLVRKHLEKKLGMSTGKEYIVAGNWKMNMTDKETKMFLNALKQTEIPENIRVMIFPPYPYLYLFRNSLRYEQRIIYGAQDVAKEEKGAYTGEVSAGMLGDMGCTVTLTGHSERRTYYGDTSKIVAEKAKAALEYQIRPMICIGETLEERKGGRYQEVLKEQMDAVHEELGSRIGECFIAYEPVWAIGTGVIPTMEQIGETHRFIHELLQSYDRDAGGKVKILYGGSVNAKNVQDIASVPYVNGFLIGGASLSAESFLDIIRLASDVS